MEYFLGIDVGGTNVKMGLVEESGNLEHKVKFPTAELSKDGKFVENFKTALGEQLEKHKKKKVMKVGIGVPGTISKDRETTLEMANLPDLNGVPFLSILREGFQGVKFHIENDANAAALGEYYFSQQKMPENFLFITLGTGVGGAAIIDGQIFKGGDGNGMEIGHIISSNGKTIEMNIGKKGILGMALTTLEGYEGRSVLSETRKLHPKAVVKAAHDSDSLALDIFYEVGKYLGEAIVSCIRILDVKTVLIGGGVSETFEYVKESMYKALHKYLTDYYIQQLDIRLATLGNNAGIIGAASLCFMDE